MCTSRKRGFFAAATIATRQARLAQLIRWDMMFPLSLRLCAYSSLFSCTAQCQLAKYTDESIKGCKWSGSWEKRKSAVVFACIVAVKTLNVKKNGGKCTKLCVANLFLSQNLVSVPWRCRYPCQQIYRYTILQIKTYSLKLFGDGWEIQHSPFGLSKINDNKFSESLAVHTY